MHEENASSAPSSLIFVIQTSSTMGGNLVNWWTAKLRTLHTGRKIVGFFNETHCAEVSFLTGRGTLIPVRGCFHEIGLFDARHFQQCGDNRPAGQGETCRAIV